MHQPVIPAHAHNVVTRRKMPLISQPFLELPEANAYGVCRSDGNLYEA